MENRLICLKDGPIEVHGPVTIEGVEGKVTRTVSMVHRLCRCGATRVAPFCDGSHENISFHSE